MPGAAVGLQIDPWEWGRWPSRAGLAIPAAASGSERVPDDGVAAARQVADGFSA